MDLHNVKVKDENWLSRDKTLHSFQNHDLREKMESFVYSSIVQNVDKISFLRKRKF